LKALGIKKIGYSIEGGIVIEKVSGIKNRPSSGNKMKFKNNKNLCFK